MEACRKRVLGSDLVDLLTGPHGVDRYTEQLAPTWALGEARAKVIDVRRTTPRSVTLTLAPNGSFTSSCTVKAGQYVNLAVDIDGRRHTRCYSPANAEGSRNLELTIGHHDGGLVSNHLYERARRGMVVGLAGVGGDFVMPAERPRRILFVSGGSGITPVMAMLRTLVAEGHPQTPDAEVAFVHYARTELEACYRDELARIQKSARRPGAARLHPIGRRRPGRPVRTRAPGRRAAGTRSGVRLRPNRFGRSGPRALRECARRELRAAGVRTDPRIRRVAESPSRTAVSTSSMTDARCWNRPNRPV